MELKIDLESFDGMKGDDILLVIIMIVATDTRVACSSRLCSIFIPIFVASCSPMASGFDRKP